MAKNTHLSLQDRSVIQTGLSGHLPFKQIAAQIGKDPSTVSKEVRKHTEVLDIGAYGRGFNPCRFSMTCQKKFLCDRCIHAGKRCALCKECYLHCDEFEEYECPTLKKPPYVCNVSAGRFSPKEGADKSLDFAFPFTSETFLELFGFHINF